jgi:hypothetical protein
MLNAVFPIAVGPTIEMSIGCFVEMILTVYE